MGTHRSISVEAVVGCGVIPVFDGLSSGVFRMSKSDVFPVGGIAFCGSCAALRKVYLIAVHDDLRGVGSSSIVFVSPNPEGCEECFQSCFAGA